ncbi:MAG: DUF2934 domain-containing protein [Acidobacteria bacterium]|nr:DUF2934 domain-containing protein [Acidobacteriota bacterium]
MAKKSTDPAAPRTTTRRRAAGATPPPGSADDKAGRNPTHDEIADAAYRRYLSRGGEHGRDFDDWLEAERELRQRTSQ